MHPGKGRRTLGALVVSIGMTLLAGCGSGNTSSAALAGTWAAMPGVVPTAAIATASDRDRMNALGVVLTTPDPAADQLLNWAEINFPQFFPSHGTTLLEGPWVYRSYMQTGVLLGINAGEVYVTGGPFGGPLLKVGRVGDLVTPPIAVKRSSYENKLLAGAMLGPIEKPWPAVKLVASEEITAGIALADFFQDGTLSAVAFSGTFNNPAGPATLAGRAYFFRRESGKWVDRTGLLLKDQTGCISPRKALVADFNGDGRPDVFASCTGYDDLVDGKLPGEAPRLLQSQPDGTYRNVPFGFSCYCHSAAAVDMSGDGHADLVVQDNALEGIVYFRNNRDGTFTMDRTRVPGHEPGHGGNRAKSIWTVEVMDVWGTGRYDLFLGGADLTDCNGCGWSWTSKIYRNRGNDTWGHDSVVVLPSLPGSSTDVYDVLVVNDHVYLHRFGPGPTWSASDDSTAIQRVSLSTLTSTTVYEHAGTFSNGYTTSHEWIILHGGMIKNFYNDPQIGVGL